MSVAAHVDPITPEELQAHALELLERDRWPRERLLALQRERLQDLLRLAIARSPYYRERLGADAENAELAELPTLPKSVLMEQFDRIVTDRRLRLADLEAFLDEADAGVAYLGEFRIFSTSGTTGMPGIFVYSEPEFAHSAAVFLRSFARLGVTGETRMAGIGAPSALHLSRQIISVLPGGSSGAPRLSVTTPLDEMVAALNAYRPELLSAYPSVLVALAEEQRRGRLSVAPRLVVSFAEVLTDDARERIESMWTRPIDLYPSTEVGVIAVGSLDHVGLHVCEEAVVEVVDEHDRPVPPGTLGSKILLTNLVNRTQPLIRYELSDAVVLEDGPDPSGRPYDRIARIDGRSDDVLELPAPGGGEVAVHPYRLRAPFLRFLDVLQYQIVHDAGRILVRIVLRHSAPRDLPDRVRAAVAAVLADAGAADTPLAVEVVDEIEREPGHAAKVKLVKSTVGRA